MVIKYGARISFTWEALGYSLDDWRPDHQRNEWINPMTNTRIADEDMPWELEPEAGIW